MVKKLPIFISTFITILGSLSPGLVQAYSYEPVTDYEVFYSATELFELKTEILNEVNNLCGENTSCRNEYLSNLSSTIGNKYGALYSFDSWRFLMTSINPTKGVMKVLYQDESLFNRYFDVNLGKGDLTEVYMAWIEDYVNNPTLDTSWFTTGEQYPILYSNIRDGIMQDGVHVILAENETTFGKKWFPNNQEVEYDISNIGVINHDMIFYAYRSTDRSDNSSLGYGNCLVSEEYQEGANCQAMISNFGTMAYFVVPSEDQPVEEESTPSSEETSPTNEQAILLEPEIDPLDIAISNETIPEDLVSSTANPGLTDQEEIIASSESPQAVFASKPELSNSEENGSQDILGQSIKLSSLKTPDTGAPANEIPSIEIPWWIVAIIVLNLAVLLWLFWPDKTIKNKKQNLSSKMS